MKNLLACLALLVAFNSSAQIIAAPYNPDADGDGLVGSADVLALLGSYGFPAPEAEIDIWGEGEVWLSNLFDVHLSYADFSYQFFLGDVTACDFSFSVMCNSHWSNVWLDANNFQGTDFRFAEFVNAQGSSCDFTGADLSYSKIWLSNFSSMVLTDATMLCILDADQTIWPDGYVLVPSSIEDCTAPLEENGGGGLIRDPEVEPCFNVVAIE